jgi:hypothetical protein
LDEWDGERFLNACRVHVVRLLARHLAAGIFHESPTSDKPSGAVTLTLKCDRLNCKEPLIRCWCGFDVSSEERGEHLREWREVIPPFWVQ